MNIVRVYTDENGKSNFEDQPLSLHPTKASPQSASRIYFKVSSADVNMDFHTAPRRQYIIVLSGQQEIGLEDGTKRIFGPGDARLMEDTTGKGHTSKVISIEPAVTIVISLA